MGAWSLWDLGTLGPKYILFGYMDASGRMQEKAMEDSNTVIPGFRLKSPTTRTRKPLNPAVRP